MRKLTSFKLNNSSLELSIHILKFMGSLVEVLFKLLVSMGKLADHLLHVEEAAVRNLASNIICWWSVGSISNNEEGSVSTTTFRTLGISSVSRHDG